MKSGPQLAYSNRTDFGDPNPLYASLRERASQHPAFIDLTVSSPPRSGLPLPTAAELLVGARGDYLPDPRGLASARAALAKSYASRSPVSQDDFILTASTSEAYSITLHVLCDPGDSILVPTPSYPLFDQLAQLAGVSLRKYALAYDGAFHLDLASLPTPAEVERENIKALFCVTPNNPTGNLLRPEELQRMRELNVPLVFDEVFRPYSRSPAGADPLARAEEHPLCLLLDGLSKRAASPGLKLGWLLAQGRDKSGFLERAEWVNDAYLSAGSLVQEALPHILLREKDAQHLVRQRLQTAREVLAESGLFEVGVTELQTEAGFSALVQFPDVKSEEEYWIDLCEAGIWIQPGGLYNLDQSPSFAISLLTPRDKLERALKVIREVVARATETK